MYDVARGPGDPRGDPGGLSAHGSPDLRPDHTVSFHNFKSSVSNPKSE